MFIFCPKKLFLFNTKINHLVLFTDKIFTSDELKQICNNCNDTNKRIKRYNIESNKINLLIDEEVVCYDGYIFDFIKKEDNFKIKFYIPELNLFLIDDKNKFNRFRQNERKIKNKTKY